MTVRLLAVAVSLGASNFIYQAVMASPNWAAAFERTFFQATALLVAWVVLAVR